jgi:hypothetical protein
MPLLLLLPARRRHVPLVGYRYISVRCYVSVPQDIRFRFQIFQSILHDITDADDADEVAVGHHNQMPHPVVGHQGHCSSQRVAGRNGDCATGHHVRRRHGKGAVSMLGDGMCDVTFRYEATYHVTTFHDQGGNAARPHQVGGGSDRRSRLDCEDVRALAIQNILNAHGHSPVFRRTCFLRLCLADTASFQSLAPILKIIGCLGQTHRVAEARPSGSYTTATAGTRNETSE